MFDYRRVDEYFVHESLRSLVENARWKFIDFMFRRLGGREDGVPRVCSTHELRNRMMVGCPGAPHTSLSHWSKHVIYKWATIMDMKHIPTRMYASNYAESMMFL